MKKYFYALMVAVFATMSLAVTGCSKDDDGDTGGDIVGSWELVDELGDAADWQQFMQFREGGSYYDVVVYGDSWNFLYDKPIYSVGTWQLDGNTLKISLFKNDCIIKKLSANELVISQMGVSMKLKRVSDGLVNGYIANGIIDNDR